MSLTSYALGEWMPPAADSTVIRSAVTGEPVANISNGRPDMAAVLAHARKVGGANLRRLTFHQRSEFLKKLGEHLNARKEILYRLSAHAGATRADSKLDVDGGIGVLFVYASKGKRELPDSTLLADGGSEMLAKGGTFVGQHVLTSLQGAAVHINAFNFPIWGTLEKLAPALLAGVPVITKPATVTSYITEAMIRIIVDSGILPEGTLQFIAGSTGDLLDHLGCQDLVSFTGSAETAQALQRHPVIARDAVRFIAERDSINSAILGPDAMPGSPEFDLFVEEVTKEMTVKAGQKCTAIRRALVPKAHVPAAIDALRERLSKIVIGDPDSDNVHMGPLVGLDQRRDVLRIVDELRSEAELVAGNPDAFGVKGADKEKGAFVPPLLLHCVDPIEASRVHSLEAFGPVSTIMGYENVDQAIALANRGQGSLVASLYSHDPKLVADVVMGVGSFHGRLVLIDRDCAAEQTGHGPSMPHMIHGGPGRAGGGEELGGMRGVTHYMQRTALQGSPGVIARIVGG